MERLLGMSRAFHVWVMRHRQRIGLIAAGHTAKRIAEYLFDWLLYGFVVAWANVTYGALWGSLIAFLIMAPLSALLCWLYIKFYDWLKLDWLGLEVLKELKNAEDTNHWFGKVFQTIVRAGDFPAFIALSLYSDPFMVTVYFREGAHNYHGLTRRDWRIFFSSVLLSNAFLTLRWTVIIALVIYLWQHVLSPFFG